MNKPFVITEDEYSHDKMDYGKKEIIVYNNVCTPPVILYTLDDEAMAGFIGKDLLTTAREMSPDERMYVRNPEMEIDVELIRAEGDYDDKYSYGQLISRLRTCQEMCKAARFEEAAKLLTQAADAIEALSKDGGIC